MSREKTAEFLADCLSNMPKQLDEAKVVIAGLKRIAQGGEWSADEALAAADAVWAAADAAKWAAWAAVRAPDWAAAWAAEAASWAASWAARAAATAAADADWSEERSAETATRAHPDPAAERERQKAKRKELGI